MHTINPLIDRPISRRRTQRGLIASILLALVVLGLTPAPSQASSSQTSSFYSYTGKTPLASLAPGTVLKTRTLLYHVLGVPLPLQAVQILYRSTNELGQPTANVTSVVRPLLQLGQSKIVSYQSFYDSLSPADEPSVAIAGGVSLGGLIPDVETAMFAPLLLAGYTIVIPDTEGQAADFAAGPEYGMNTLDSLRAVTASSQLGLSSSAKIGMMGYSGGAIATEWAAELAKSYAPDLAGRIIGSAIGGVFVDPLRNLSYIQGSPLWSGLIPVALNGLARSFHLDLTPYLNSYGVGLLQQTQTASILTALGAHPGLTWKQIAKPAYPTAQSVPALVTTTNQLIMGSRGTPTSPMFIGQGNGGYVEGTSGGTPGIGAGDGVMVTGDVRTLARQYCTHGVAIDYQEYDGLSHLLSTAPWLPQAYSWLMDRFAGRKAPSNCSTIKPGNPIGPVAVSR
ncbi:MAG TPA: lipase family protein [Marmoricola sp.]|jgi:hypothetical protein|nr:lipase family protein [Marmoricola sp.]